MATRMVTRSCTLSWRNNIVVDEQDALRIAKAAKRVAVLGIKTEKQENQPAFYVPSYLKSVGVRVIPVPVYFPDVKEILGETVFRRLQDIPNASDIDIVDVFRRPKDLEQHLEDILKAQPKVVWLQSGISSKVFEEEIAKAGIKVVPSRCLLVDHQRATMH